MEPATKDEGWRSSRREERAWMGEPGAGGWRRDGRAAGVGGRWGGESVHTHTLTEQVVLPQIPRASELHKSCPPSVSASGSGIFCQEASFLGLDSSSDSQQVSTLLPVPGTVLCY